jgi:hypothetical protein
VRQQALGIAVATVDDRKILLAEFELDPVLAHQALFRHRHTDLTPDLHKQLIEEFPDPFSQRLFMAFRGGGKSTISEEGLIIKALFRQFHNGLILGENEQRAAERLQSIKHELDTNETIEQLCGVMHGTIWQETKIVLANGVCIQAVGSGQSLRGIKHLSWRPDFLLVDDVEGDEDALTTVQREKTRQWFFSTVIPVLTPKSVIRMMATPLDAESLPVTLSRVPSWRTTTVPITVT